MQLFGKTLFEKKATPTLYDFAQYGILNMSSNYGFEPVAVYAVAAGETAPGQKVAKKKVPEAPKVTPKDLYEMKALNTPDFKIALDDLYIDEQIDVLKIKLAVLGKQPKPARRNQQYGVIDSVGSVAYGRQECQSMIERLENRRVLRDGATSNGFAEWPYTTNEAIQNLLNNHKHLEAKNALSSIPDLPKDAVKAIDQYTKLTISLCNKKPVFYLISEKQEREQVSRRRDPILLAQSPFGFFWQVLGAWDKEVVFLDEI